jgi:hypothetical protein
VQTFNALGLMLRRKLAVVVEALQITACTEQAICPSDYYASHVWTGFRHA